MRKKHQLAIPGSSCRSERKLLTLQNEGKWIRLVDYHLYSSLWNSRGANWRQRISWKHSDYTPFYSFLPHNRELKEIAQKHGTNLKKIDTPRKKRPQNSQMNGINNSSISLILDQICIKTTTLQKILHHYGPKSTQNSQPCTCCPGRNFSWG